MIRTNLLPKLSCVVSELVSEAGHARLALLKCIALAEEALGARARHSRLELHALRDVAARRARDSLVTAGAVARLGLGLLGAAVLRRHDVPIGVEKTGRVATLPIYVKFRHEPLPDRP